jgi:hypothetical protein
VKNGSSDMGDNTRCLPDVPPLVLCSLYGRASRASKQMLTAPLTACCTSCARLTRHAVHPATCRNKQRLTPPDVPNRAVHARPQTALSLSVEHANGSMACDNHHCYLNWTCRAANLLPSKQQLPSPTWFSSENSYLSVSPLPSPRSAMRSAAAFRRSSFAVRASSAPAAASACATSALCAAAPRVTSTREVAVTLYARSGLASSCKRAKHQQCSR